MYYISFKPHNPFTNRREVGTVNVDAPGFPSQLGLSDVTRSILNRDSFSRFLQLHSPKPVQVPPLPAFLLFL